MSKSRDLRLNTFDRYVKRSDQLVLESYSSCEVPLGCGGSILRWADPSEAMYFRLLTDFGDRKAKVSLDGLELSDSRVKLTPGRHVLAIIFASSPLPLRLRLELAYDKSHTAPEDHSRVPTATLATADDGLWFGTDVAPRGPWMTSPVPDAGWTVLTRTAAPQRSKPFWGERTFEKIAAVGMESGPGMAWVRRAFDVRADGQWVIE